MIGRSFKILFVGWTESWQSFDLQNGHVVNANVIMRNNSRQQEERPMDLPMTLTMEQQFNMKVYEDQVKAMNVDQAQEFVLEIMRQLMIKDNVIRHLMKQAL
jgi:Phycobilisome degradation protein nblA